MLPSIAHLNSVEMIRDGGSLAASFQGADSAEYWLFFQVSLSEVPDGTLERLAYQAPAVVERQAGTSVDVSWTQAKVLLNQLRPLLRDDAHRGWLETMCVVAEGDGALPPGIERNLGKPRSLSP